MDITLLIKSFAGLSAILAILIVLYLYFFHAPKEKRGKKLKPHIREEKPRFESLVAVIRDKNATQEELQEAVNLIIKYYGDIPKKRGFKADPKFEIYAEILFRITHHPSTSKEIILQLDSALENRNPEYKLELDDSLTKGLDTRRSR